MTLESKARQDIVSYRLERALNTLNEAVEIGKLAKTLNF